MSDSLYMCPTHIYVNDGVCRLIQGQPIENLGGFKPWQGKVLFFKKFYLFIYLFVVNFVIH